jgi:hypothetical protein
MTTRYTVLFVGLCAAVWMSAIWTDSFMKIHEMRVPYRVLLTLLLFLALLGIGHAGGLRHAWWKLLLEGAMIGQIAGTVAITLSNFFIPNGWQRTIKTIQVDGLADVLMSDTVVAFILGGWVIGGLLFLCFRVLFRRTMEARVGNGAAS